jgi:hypothetical protein
LIHRAEAELLTSYTQLARFGKQLVDVINGVSREAFLIEERLK